MREDFAEAVEIYASKTGVPESTILDAIGKALHTAYKKATKHENIHIDVNENIKSIQIFSKKTVVEEVSDSILEISIEEAIKKEPDIKIGDEYLEDINPMEMGRIAAQVSHQVIIENIHRVKQDILYDEYQNKIGTIVTGVFQRKTRKDDIIVDLSDTEGLLPFEKQLSKDRLKIGEKVRVYIKNVEKNNNNIKILLSRTDPAFVKRLFELEVPELSSNIIEIKGIARDPGERSKIAVYSDKRDIDPHSPEPDDLTDQSDHKQTKNPEDTSRYSNNPRTAIFVPWILPEKPHLNTKKDYEFLKIPRCSSGQA